MQLPASVREQIEQEAERVGFAALKRAADDLSCAYRAGQPAGRSNAERASAYLATRMPATYAAAFAVLHELSPLAGSIGTILDAGAGTGAASLAARALFPQARLTLLERDPEFARFARRFLPDADSIAADIAKIETLPPHDLAIASYSLSEFGAPLARRLWSAARVALVVIEPGTPRGFARIRDIRAELLTAGAHMVAPCPMETACPIVEPDWCHFAARVERSSLHRRIKGGDLGYEDEKFSYVVLARTPVELPAARIVRRPRHHPGLIEIENCTPAGLRAQRIAKSDRARFRAARKAAWGDAGIS